ncbi:efflux RND transporter periplasmic adaptor subunit [Ilyomonas limi]|uniref:Efflux RND transporter periplasmic adaptor subunit n=1 Tax=Ilyomonas limi TaxID=2575867 RepID=A0A4U3L533_9BACT|nr:efflux RND transporter periplasmic adaptor subunit [Ilyomonas limi]TKK70258.1 efflux RND transporter periplasmic adaptor subunit [Ilyomonas limi]
MNKFFICVSVLIGLTACGEEQQKVSEPETLPVTRLKAIDTSVSRPYVADIQAVQNVEIRNRIPGFLEKIYVDEGQQVKKGQLLFHIEDKQYKEDAAKAKAALSIAIADSKSAELELERVKLLVDKNVVTASELDVAKAKLSAAKARIQELQSTLSNVETKLSYTNVYAPFDGVINRIPLKVGSLLNEGDLLTTATDISSVYTYFNISEDEYLNFLKTEHKLNGENDVRLILANGSPYKYNGKIETIESEFDENTGSIAVRAIFPNPDKILRHGSTGTIELPMDIDNSVILPEKSVLEIQDKDYVFVLTDSNRLVMKSFQPRLRFSHFYVVKSGLQPGDRILYEGIQEARDGMIIKPNFITMDSLLAQKL